MKIPTAMDDSSVSHHNGGQVGSQIGVSVNNKQNEEPSQSVQYSIPGILHFIQHEWARFELERSQWEVDRAEFEVIFFLFLLSQDTVFRHMFVSNLSLIFDKLPLSKKSVLNMRFICVKCFVRFVVFLLHRLVFI